MARCFLYLAADVDWFSRRVLAWRLSISMGVSFCIEGVEGALSKYGAPEIFNSDQGSQFASMAFTGLHWPAAGQCIAISMDGRGAWHDHVFVVFVERLWRNIKSRRSTCAPMTPSRMCEPRSANIWPSTMAGDRTRALTG